MVSAGVARALAEDALARADCARERRTVMLPWRDLAVRPGDRVAVRGRDGLVEPGRWRVGGWDYAHGVLALELQRLVRASVPGVAAAGRAAAAADLPLGTTIVAAFELPSLDDMVLAVPRLAIAAAGTSEGWRRAALLVSTDDGLRWDAAGATAAPATLGVLTSPPGAGPTALFDLAATIEVELARADMALGDADDAALDRGANLAMVGDELVQFGSAEPIGACRWRLSRLLRGRRGTSDAVGTQSAGDRFVLIERDALVLVDLPLATLGGTVRVLASGAGDVDAPVAAVAAVPGRSVLPLAPVALSAAALPGGDMRVGWVRSSRAGWGWIDGTDAPLGEESEAYRVRIVPATGSPRSEAAGAPAIVVPAADRSGGPCIVEVRQAGSHGESPAASIVLPAL